MAIVTVLEIVNAAEDELGLTRSTSLAATAAQAVQMRALLTRLCRELVGEHLWSGLIVEHEQALTAGQGTYPLPADFDRFVPDTAWDRTNHWPLMGPDGRVVGRWRREAQVAQTGPRRSIERQHNQLLVWPVPASPESIVYDYMSNHWCHDVVSDTWRRDITNSTDATIYDPDVVVLGLKFRYRAAKGMDATGSRLEFARALSRAIGADTPAGIIDLAGRSGNQFLSIDNVPDSGFGV